MISDPTYRKPLYIALGLHVFLAILLISDSAHKTPVLTMETQTTAGIQQPEVIKAVSVESKEIMQAVDRLKEEREEQQRAEIQHQNNLKRQAEAAKQQRIKEQQQLAKLKDEANKIAISRKKQAEEEQKHLQELAEQKALEAKKIKELQEERKKLAKQKEEEKKLVELKKKQQLEKIKAEKAKTEQQRLAKMKAEQEQKKLAQAQAAQRALDNAQKQARIAGEVDKYKALIVNAIGRNWILPENVDSSLSSQFRIRLAPNGAVIDVTLTRSSGDPLLDRSAQTAIQKASPLPVPTDAETFNMFRDISLTVRPEQVRG